MSDALQIPENVRWRITKASRPENPKRRNKWQRLSEFALHVKGNLH